MPRIISLLLLSALVLSGLLIVNLAGAVSLPPQPTGLPSAQVVRVVDGDTLDVDLNGTTERLRLIGMDTPETKDPRTPVQCYGQEASNRAATLLSGKTVYLEADAGEGERDTYQRLLRYVWLDGRLFNLDMIADGYAHEYTYDTPYKYQATFRQAEQEAAAADRGLWASTTCNGDTTQAATAVNGVTYLPLVMKAEALPTATPTPIPTETSLPEIPTSTPTAIPAPTTTTRPNCHPSYPGVCIPPPPPDLDCGDIPYRNFVVLPPDPHRLDGDGDGIGCES